MTSGFLQRHVADETRVVRMTRFGHQLTVGHDTRVHVAAGTQTLVTGVPGAGPLARCQDVVTVVTIGGGHVSGGGHGPLAVRGRVDHVLGGGIVGGGGQRLL